MKPHSRAKIIDRFTDLPVSRERKRQLRKNAFGLCLVGGCSRRMRCGGFCRAHYFAHTDAVAERRGRRRYYLSKWSHLRPKTTAA